MNTTTVRHTFARSFSVTPTYLDFKCSFVVRNMLDRNAESDRLHLVVYEARIE